MTTEDELSRTKTPERLRRGRHLVFGYTTINWPGLALCPCRDPGNYLMMEHLEDGADQLRCWCGSTMRVEFDTPEERALFIQAGLR